MERKMKKFAGTIVKIFICAMLFAVTVDTYALNARQIKGRMKARLSQVDILKQQGIIGENNKGYLELLKKNAQAEKLVAAENKDRKLIYTAIARQQKVTADLVGKRRAIMIAKRAVKGVMLQNAKGKWYKK
jgi:uncharacterized protein YdbL (DUF1318 family)